MIRFLKTAFIPVILFLALQNTYGQKQVSVTDYIAQKFLKYCDAVPREDIFIHTDREDYIAGEDLWFNIFLIDRQKVKSTSYDNIVYFELLNQENRPVVQKRIKIEQGFGPGQIILPDTLSTGTYTLRAYTSWMKNFLPENCFMKDIRIYNAFSKKPFKGKVYKSEIRNEGSGTGSDNPELTLKVNNMMPDTLDILISADNAYLRNNQGTFFIFIQTHGVINYISSEKTLTESTRVSIPKKILTPGINHLTVFNSKGQPLLEKLIYTPDKAEQLLTLYSTGTVKTRSKISLEIDVDNSFINPLQSSNLSISVAPETNIGEISDINDYLIFGSEFGISPWSVLKGKKISDLSPDAIDSLLLNVKSNWINWEAILSDDLPVLGYRHEATEHYLWGRLINRNPATNDSGKFIFMSTPGKEAVFQYARTDKEGDFSFTIPIDDNYKDLIIQPAEANSNYTIKIESPFSDKIFLSEIWNNPGKDNTPSYIPKFSVNYQVSKIYGTSFIADSLYQFLRTSKTKRFYGKPDIELIMADYIKLPVMEEVFFELIPGVLLKNKKSGYEIRVADPVENTIYETSPGLLIDGVMINDPSIIANLDPEIIEKIDVVKDRYFIGDYLFYGLVNVITKDGDYSIVNLPGYATRLQYRPVDPVRPFVSPDYSSEEVKNNRIPDFRNTLYWNPSVKPDKDGKARVEFWSSDYGTDYIINIQGMTSDGIPVSVRKIIKIQ